MADHAERCATAIALAQVADYLERRDIPYSLAYGTLLGAVRHGGFIPHDDDVDILLAKRHSRVVYDIAAHYGVGTRFNTAPWGRDAALQKLHFPGALTIDVVNEDLAELAYLLPLLSDFFEDERPALTRIEFCGRSFSCVENYSALLDACYGADCLDYVDADLSRPGRDYRGIPRREKLPLQEYIALKRNFVQPDLRHEVIAKPHRFRLGLMA